VILTLDNRDGLGAVDYSSVLDRSQALTITRTLNAPSIATGRLCLAGTSLATPVRQARVVIASDSGTTLFTGYLATEPVAIYAGVASAGAVYRLAWSAISDEWLLDKQAAGAQPGLALGNSGAAILSQLVARLDGGRLATTGLSGGRDVGVFVASPAPWSSNAGAAANATYSAYRAVNGALSLTPNGAVTHAFSDGDGSLTVSALKTASARELANDITVSGEMEAAAYWTELFLGDGTTTAFPFAGEPDAPNAGHAVLLADDFSAAVFDTQTWQINDPGSRLALGANGLVFTGGNGFDGQTTLVAANPVELGGTIVAEVEGVILNAGSVGVLCGLYDGATAQANCFAGFSVTQSGGQTVVQPIVNGLVTGTAFTVTAGDRYTFRIHLHCPEVERVKQVFYAMVDGVVESFGGGAVTAPMALVFEARDLGHSSNTPATVLYDGSVASSPVQSTFVAVNSIGLFGSVAATTVTRTGSAWITCRSPATGAVSTQLAGKVSDGVNCSVVSSAAGQVTFFAGSVPAAAALVTVVYRGRRRAVARLADAASIAAEAAGGSSVGTARWVGKVLRPLARSSEDCEYAAQAILSFATNRAAAVTGSYTAVNPPTSDIWPGDVLALTANGGSTSVPLTVLVRRVEVVDQGAAPEALTYRIAFANDWAEGLGIDVSEAIAADALLPVTALTCAPGANVLANLQQLTATGTGSGTSAALAVDAGTDPPAGGGFEVRRHDGGFGTGAGAANASDLVLRSPVRVFSIPLAAVGEKFFVRMYDASTPPLYSRESSAIVSQLPVA
jgi:hypothetical protein